MESPYPYRPMLLITILYTVAYFPLLLMRGAYWDGWIFYAQFANKNYAWVYEMFAPERNYFHYYMFRFLDAFPDPVLVERGIVFVSWLL